MSNSLQKGKVREAQRLSKTKQKELKRLQEKEKKLLLFKSISTLQKYKISDGAHSLLQSSGTIGQAETMKEKRRRAVQLSKAGLEVPEDILPVKKKGRWNGESDNAATMELDFGQNCTETGSHDNGLMAVECTEVGDNAATMDADKCMPEEQKSSPLVSCSQYKVHSTKTEDHSTDGSNVYGQNLNVPAENAIKKSASTPIVEHVSRPNEVEKKRKDLPIIMMEQEIMEAIHEHSVVILCGETGCGKTTQVPQFLYEAGYGSRNYSERKGMIGVTQPRRVAVLATAKRVSFELGLRLGKEVGFQVRHDKMIGDSCSIKFMTDGILLREIQSDFLLKQYSVIILDEAHERSLNTDILVGMLSRIIRLRQKLYAEQQEKIISGARISPENMITQLKLVLMSATLRVEDFVSDRKLFHEVPPLLEVPVRQFPVTIHFSKRTQQDYLGQAYKKIMSIHRRLPSGGILVFVTGQREVEFLCKKLRKASRQLAENNYKKKVDSSITPSSEVDLDIREAFEVRSSSPDQQTDRFSFYDEDEGNLEMDSYSSDSGTESELEADMEEVPEKNGLVLDFLKDADGLSSLKASFEALAGNLSNQTSKEKTDVPDSLTLEAQAEVAAPSVSPLYVLPLYAMLPASAQLQVFEDVPEGERLVVVATNVAETSLTIPGIRYVVDTGKEKVKNYNYASGMATYEVQWISKASAAQRAGRAGRTGPGHCYRLYSSAAYSKDDIFSEFSCPEISKIPVDGVVLLMKSMYIDKVANFPFPTPPETAALVEAEHCLRALEALDTQGRLTPMGKAMAQYPMSPRHSRMLLTVIKILSHQQDYARANFILAYAVASAAALSCPNPFIMQFGGSSTAADDIDLENHDEENLQNQQEKQRKKKAKSTMKEARERFCNPSSDALTVAYALQLFELAENSLEFCQSNSLHLKTMEAMSKLRKQLLQMIFHQSKFSKEFGWHLGSAEDVEHTWRVNSSKQPLRINEEELLGQAICAGWADRVAKRVRRVSESSDKDHKTHAVEYQSSALNDTIYLNRSSSVSRMAPDFVVYTELLQTKRPYMHGVTSVKSVWMAKNASSLCSFSAPLADPKPYYEPLSDQVLCWVSPTFGRHNWQLPLHSIPIKDDDLRLCVFACALLEGNVLPCMKSAQRFLSIPPLSILRPDALGQRRVGDLLNGLKIGRRKIDSRTKLREAWNKNPQFLQLEIKHWFQDAFHHRFAGFWEQMHREVLLEGNELFPKMSKDKKKAK